MWTYLLPHACHTPCPSHNPWFHHPSNIWRRLQNMKLPITEFSAASEGQIHSSVRAHELPFTWQTKFHIRIEQMIKSWLCTFWCSYSYIANGKTKHSGPNAELNPICYLLALLGARYFLHVSRIRVKSLTLRLLMSYIYIYIYIYTYTYIYGAPILEVSRSHTTTQHSR